MITADIDTGAQTFKVVITIGIETDGICNVGSSKVMEETAVPCTRNPL
jgi:hypothetical protein